MRATISKAKIEDLDDVLRLEQRVWNENTVNNKYDLGTSIRFGHAFVAKHRGKVVGAILAMRTADGSVFVQDWFVDPNHRGKGIGRTLYSKLIESAAAPIVTLVSPKFSASVAVHKKLGFKPVKLVKNAYFVGDTARFLMRKESKRSDNDSE